MRPTIQLQLYRNEIAMEAPITLEDGVLSYTWTDLLKFDEKGNEYVYTIDEVEIPNGYTKTISADGLTVTNTYIESEMPSDNYEWDILIKPNSQAPTQFRNIYGNLIFSQKLPTHVSYVHISNGGENNDGSRGKAKSIYHHYSHDNGVITNQDGFYRNYTPYSGFKYSGYYGMGVNIFITAPDTNTDIPTENIKILIFKRSDNVDVIEENIIPKYAVEISASEFVAGTSYYVGYIENDIFYEDVKQIVYFNPSSIIESIDTLINYCHSPLAN